MLDAMYRKLSQTFTLSNEECRVLQEFIQASKKLSTALYGKAEIHCLLSLSKPSIVRGRQAIVLIYSKLSLRAVDRRIIASDSASHALSDVFHIAQRVLEMENNGIPNRTTLPRAPFPQNLTIPTWLTGNRTDIQGNSLHGINRLEIEGTTFESVKQLSLVQLTKVYGEFFHYFWNQSKIKLGWKGKIIYEKLTPPWFKREVLFLYGPNNCSSIPCKYGELPR